MSLRIRVEPSLAPLTIDVLPSGLRPADPEVLVVVDDERTADHTVRLDVDGFRVWYLLEAIPTGLVDLTVMFVEETARLFLGGKRLSCVVDVARGVVEHRFEHCLFWGFDRATRPGFVYEAGELDCLFRGLDGRVLGHVPVDPPWDCQPEAGGLRFESMVHGTTFLAFPGAQA